MKHLLKAIGDLFPDLKPVTDAALFDMAEMEAQSKADEEKFQQEREAMRKRSEERRNRILNRP